MAEHARLELVDRVHQPHVAFLDQVAHRHAVAAVAGRDADDEAEVGLDQPLAGFIAPFNNFEQMSAAFRI